MWWVHPFMTSGRARWSSDRAPCSPTCCWRTRSTGRPPRLRPHSWRPWEKVKVSADGETRRLPQPFVVLATDNPIEYEGTYELPEAQLDRFLMRLRLGYLRPDQEVAMVQRRLDRGEEHVELAQVIDAAELLAMRDSLEQVEVSPDLVDYVVAIVGATRDHPQYPSRGQPAGEPGARAVGPGGGAHAPARLRHPGRHQADSSPRARSPGGAAPRAVGAPGQLRRRHCRGGGDSTDAAYRPDGRRGPHG